MDTKLYFENQKKLYSFFLHLDASDKRRIINSFKKHKFINLNVINIQFGLSFTELCFLNKLKHEKVQV